MKSFGLWYKESKSIESEELKARFDLHVNFWSESVEIDGRKKVPYLDIGIKVTNYEYVDKLVFQCPFRVEQEEFEDLSNAIADQKTADIIFNDNCNVSTKMSVAIIATEKEKLIVVSKEFAQDLFKLVNKGSRTNIEIDMSTFVNVLKNKGIELSDTVAYARFRIKTQAMKDSIYFDSEPINKSFDSAFSGTRIIDFKINSKRNLDEQIYSEVKPEEFPQINKIHLLIMEPASYNVESFSKEGMTCRELENDLWSNYLGGKNNIIRGHILAYHWKKDSENNGSFKEYSCLVKVQYSRAKLSTIAAYVTIAVAIGMFGSFLVALIQMATGNSLNCDFTIVNIIISVTLMIIGWLIGKYIK